MSSDPYKRLGGQKKFFFESFSKRFLTEIIVQCSLQERYLHLKIVGATLILYM